MADMLPNFGITHDDINPSNGELLLKSMIMGADNYKEIINDEKKKIEKQFMKEYSFHNSSASRPMT